MKRILKLPKFWTKRPGRTSHNKAQASKRHPRFSSSTGLVLRLGSLKQNEIHFEGSSNGVRASSASYGMIQICISS